jgi:hypothetical protein
MKRKNIVVCHIIKSKQHKQGNCEWNSICQQSEVTTRGTSIAQAVDLDSVENTGIIHLRARLPPFTRQNLSSQCRTHINYGLTFIYYAIK